MEVKDNNDNNHLNDENFWDKNIFNDNKFQIEDKSRSIEKDYFIKLSKNNSSNLNNSQFTNKNNIDFVNSTVSPDIIPRQFNYTSRDNYKNLNKLNDENNYNLNFSEDKRTIDTTYNAKGKGFTYFSKNIYLGKN